MELRSQETARPVLVGFAPNVTATVSKVASPAKSVSGDAAPTPEGLVGLPQILRDEAVLCGDGVYEIKSVTLLSVSVQPFAKRKASVVLVSAGAAPLPSKQFAPSYPTKSTTLPASGQEPVNAI